MDGFEFKIGDVVTHRAMACEGGQPQRLFVIGQIVEEGSAGTERRYRVRPVSSGGFGSDSFTNCCFELLDIEACALPAESP